MTIDPADARECDGYPGLIAPADDEPCPCSDPGDCVTCS